MWRNLCFRRLIIKRKVKTVKGSSIIKIKKIERIEIESIKIGRGGKEKSWVVGNLKTQKNSIERINA